MISSYERFLFERHLDYLIDSYFSADAHSPARNLLSSEIEELLLVLVTP